MLLWTLKRRALTSVRLAFLRFAPGAQSCLPKALLLESPASRYRGRTGSFNNVNYILFVMVSILVTFLKDATASRTLWSESLSRRMSAPAIEASIIECLI